jgi:hypothetical protein
VGAKVSIFYPADVAEKLAVQGQQSGGDVPLGQVLPDKVE